MVRRLPTERPAKYTIAGFWAFGGLATESTAVVVAWVEARAVVGFSMSLAYRIAYEKSHSHK
jgi:hypothetical protein